VKRTYHLPTRIDGAAGLSPDERARLERAILRAVERAVTASAAPGSEVAPAAAPPRQDFREVFDRTRHRPEAGTYSVPSYQKQGGPEDVVVFEEGDVIVAARDRVIEKAPPFQGALVLALPVNHYVKVAAHRYATTNDVAHAVVWGHLLFGPTTWVVASRAETSGTVKYYVAGLEERLTEADLKVQPFGAGPSPAHGATGAFQGRVLPSLPGGYTVESVYFPGGGRTAPSSEAFAAFGARLAEARQQPSLPLDVEQVRTSVFQNIDRLLATGADDDLEKAADLLAELDATAFSLVDAATRVRYLEALVRAWTAEPQEKAIVEVFKSVQDRAELNLVIQKLKDARLWEQLFDDLDSELWSLLVALGERFGDKAPFSLTQLVHLLLEAKLLSVASGLRQTDKGLELSLGLVDEAYEAARGFVRSLGGAVEGLWALISHPEKIVEGINQLVRMIVTVELARWGDPEAMKTVGQALTAVGEQVLAGLKGAAVTGMGPAVERRVKWAVVWEVASWFIGVGEVKAALEAVGLTERLQALGRILRIAGLVGKAAEGERAATKLEQLARLLSKASKTLTEEEAVLCALSRLPEEDVARLTAKLEKLSLGEATDAARLLQGDAELADVLRKAEVLDAWAALAGGHSDELAEAFRRLTGPAGLRPDEVEGLLKLVPEGGEGRFARALRAIPEGEFGAAGSAPAEYLRALAASPGRTDALLAMGHGTVAALYRRAGGEAARLDEYLAAVAELEQKLPAANRAVEYRRLLDQLERGDEAVWLELEDARAAKFAPAEARLDPQVVEGWIEEELKRGGGAPAAGAEPVQVAGPAPAPPPAASLREALARVDLSALTPAERARLHRGWLAYSGRAARRLHSENDYVRFVYGKRTGQLPRVSLGPRDLGAAGAVEQMAGHLLERAVNEHLPPGSRNARDIPTQFGNVRPDHLPPGRKAVRLAPDGSVSAAGTGTPFSARFVADSKYRDLVPTTDQTRGFVKLAALSDEKRLVFYVRWQEHFGDPAALFKDLDVGYVLPERFVPQVVQSGVREEARKAGVTIELISDPLWR
jgi:hypothetical protein